MKTWSRFFLLMLFILGLTFCEKPDPPTTPEKLNSSVSLKQPQLDSEVDTIVYIVLLDSEVDTMGNIDLPEHLNPRLNYGLVSDIDNNIYRTIQIGTQNWMAENLRTTRYNDGSKITNVRWYNDNISYKNTYGALYDHYVVNTGKLCPTNWHVPTDEEWKQLEMALGMSRASADTSYGDFDVFGMGERGTDQGTKMKSATGWLAWEGILVKGTNTSGFSALPAGDFGGWGNLQYECAGVATTFWCFGDLWARTLSTTDSKVGRAIYFANNCFSIRCLKD